jgi:hypothetical protein
MYQAFPGSDYYGGCETVGLASLRSSRVPYVANVVGRLRCPVRALASPYGDRLPAASTWLSRRLTSSAGSMGFSRFPISVEFHPWTLGFRQYSFHHIGQPLPERLD